jgi:pSer/pThr/pTyr-binding forkhead associated (FHA) protein
MEGEREAGDTLPRNAAGKHGRDEGKTVGLVQKKLGVDPVVGWLVCVEGPDRGRDYRVRSGRNFIGRAQQMHISIGGDPAVSREKHAAISYDPKHGHFKLLPGEGSGLTYVNDETVDVPVELKPYDTIELGETKLKFVPFCGEYFRWTTEAAGGEPSA